MAAQAQTRPLNDTGITFCGGATTGNNTPCLAADPAGQDKHYGRDAAAQAGTLTKVGASSAAPNGTANGFDYTKISNIGADLPASATLGAGANDWACTRDNVTGLTWEVKTTSGLRNQSHTYTWFMTGSPDGNNGTASGGSCHVSGRCDTEKFTEDVNAVGLCGNGGWRMPTRKELASIVDRGRTNPAIDPTYFPNTLPSSNFWSGSPHADSLIHAWIVFFSSGYALNFSRSSFNQVRLVREGQ